MIEPTLTPAADRFRYAVAALACLGLAAVLGHHRLLSLSVDMALHLQEVRLSERFWTFPAWAKASLSELWWYPKLSHRLAALLVRLGSGEIDAMTTVACLCTAANWLTLLGWARRASMWVLAAGTALALLDAWLLRAAMGGELIGNFFFPQIVAEAVFWLALSAGALLLPRSRGAAAAWLTAATVLCGCVHLLPTLKLAGAGIALLALDGVRTWRRERRIAWADAAGIVALPAAVGLNPFFAAMRWIAANDGSVNFAVPIGPEGVSLAALGLLALSGWVLWPRLRPGAEADDAGADGAAGRAAEVLAAVGAATALAALAQEAALVLGHDGSPYAVKKHGFGVFTMLAFLAPLAVGRVLPAGLRARLGARAPAWSAPVAAAAVLLVLFARPSLLDVRQAQRLIAGAERVRERAGLPAAGAVFASDTTPPLIAFAVNVADLWNVHGEEAYATLMTGHPVHPEAQAHLLTRVGDLYDAPGCRVGAPVDGVVQVRGACSAPPAARFGAGAPGTAHLREGWAAPETGVWSQAPHAAVDLPLPPGAERWPAGWVVASTFGFTPAQSPRRTVTLRAAGKRETFVFGRDTAVGHDFHLPLDAAALKAGRLRLEFEIADAVSPQALGLGDDPRRLGVGLSQVRILPDRTAAR